MIIDAAKTTDADRAGEPVREMTEVELKLAIGGKPDMKPFPVMKLVDVASPKFFTG